MFIVGKMQMCIFCQKLLCMIVLLSNLTHLTHPTSN